MNTKHTIGPWILKNNLIEAGENGFVIAEVTDSGVLPMYLTKEVAEANAKLIAASPELLEAFQAIVARANGDFDNPALLKFGLLETTAIEDILAIATEAINKATL